MAGYKNQFTAKPVNTDLLTVAANWHRLLPRSPLIGT